MNLSPHRLVHALSLLGLSLSLAWTGSAHAHFCWIYTEQLNRFTYSEAWALGGCPHLEALPGFDSADQSTWTIGHFHCNWHTNFGVLRDQPGAIDSGEDTGARFIGFHRQFIADFDTYRICGDYDPATESSPCETMDGPVGFRLEPWDPNPEPGHPIPGNNEDAEWGYDRGLYGDESDPGWSGRPAGAECPTCTALPADFLGESGGTYANLNELGWALDSDEVLPFNWHAAFHCAPAASSVGDDSPGNDACTTEYPTYDPAFWMAHRQLDEIARNWQSLQETDYVVVIDRSGSMNDNCSTDADGDGDAFAPDASESPCRINDAKVAASALADFIPNGGGHRVAVVSFGSNATTELGLTSVDTGLAGIQAAINGITINCASGCQTSIGDGLAQAVSILSGSAADHKAILLLTDGMENTAQYIDDVRGSITAADIQVCAIGYAIAFDDPEDRLRSLCEETGGLFIADDDLADDGAGSVTLTKFFIECFSALGDEALIEDPVVQIPANLVSSELIPIDLCGTDLRLSVAGGFEWGSGLASCPLTLVLEAPNMDLVNPSAAGVEHGGGNGRTFIRVPLPYNGQATGRWMASFVRPQRVYTHGFPTDGFGNLEDGITLARREIHRLFPTGLNTALYYEDGSLTGLSAYREALNRELVAGTITSLTVATSAADFNAKLASSWNLIVFARQMNRTPQVYDGALQSKICQGQKALLTDFLAIGTNPILACAGATGLTVDRNWLSILGDGRLVLGNIALADPGYGGTFTYGFSSAGSWLSQSSTPTGHAAVVGYGADCNAQWLSYASLARGLARARPLVVRPRVLVGEQILATFRLPSVNRPVGDWDSVSATVALERPGLGGAEEYPLYDDGTHGDRLRGNNVWSNLIASPANMAGPHTMKAHFRLSKGGCTIVREAEYAITAHNEPQSCIGLTRPRTQHIASGGNLRVPMCVVNRCTAPDSYRVTISAPKWLCTIDSAGVKHPLPSLTWTTETATFQGVCLNEEQPDLYVAIPPQALPGDSVVVTYKIRSLGHAGQDTTSTVTVRATGRPTAIAPPPPGFHVAAVVNNSTHTASFSLALPDARPVSIRVFDAHGRLVRTVLYKYLAAGVYTTGGHRASGVAGNSAGTGATWDGRDLRGRLVSSGVYLYEVIAGDERVTGGIVMLR